MQIDGRPYDVDIRFRMLAPHELAQAQGFDRNDQFCGTRGDQVRQIGNAARSRIRKPAIHFGRKLIHFDRARDSRGEVG